MVEFCFTLIQEVRVGYIKLIIHSNKIRNKINSCKMHFNELEINKFLNESRFP